MNQNLFAIAGAALLAVAGLSGCASDRTKIPAVTFRDEVHAVPAAHPLTETEMLAQAMSQPPVPFEGAGWQEMFDGQSPGGWRVTDFDRAGQVEFRDGLILLRAGETLSGIHWTGDMPETQYEISLEAMRVSGSDYFCALTFPVRDSFCTLVVGGWGGAVVGLSNLDDVDASENETTQVISFENGRWYHIRLRVTADRIKAWIEQKQVVDVEIAGRKISLSPGDIEHSMPLGITSLATTAALREIEWRRVSPADPGNHDSEK